MTPRTDHDHDADDEPVSSTDDDLPAPYPPKDYDADRAFMRTIGRASSHCESCGDEIDGWDLDDFLVGQLRNNDFSAESHVVICRECEAHEDWRANVQERRAALRDETILSQLSGWLNAPPIETLFLRRVGAAFGALLVAVIVLGLLSPSTVTWALQTGPTQILSGLVAYTLAVYWGHTHERERNDMRGTRVREFGLGDPPWAHLIGGAVGVVFSAVAIFTGGQAMAILGSAGYLASAMTVFITSEHALRADRCHPRVHWTPRYDTHLFIVRSSAVVGTLIMIFGAFGSGSGALLEIVTMLPAVIVIAYATIHHWADLGEEWRLLHQYGSNVVGGEDS